MFKYDTHVHTAETSDCASAPGAEQVRRYKALGYDGIIITDHFINGNCRPAIRECQDRRERAELFCKGYEAAKAEGDRIGFKVWFGWEYSYQGADLLTYGLDKQWLLDNPDVCDISVYEYCDRVHRDGGYIVHAHPFREADYLREIKLLPMWTDVAEIFNCGNRDEAMNERAKWYAAQYGLPVTAGSDNHHLSAAKLSGIITQRPLETVFDYIEAVKNSEVQLIVPPDNV